MEKEKEEETKARVSGLGFDRPYGIVVVVVVGQEKGMCVYL